MPLFGAGRHAGFVSLLQYSATRGSPAGAQTTTPRCRRARRRQGLRGHRKPNAIPSANLRQRYHPAKQCAKARENPPDIFLKPALARGPGKVRGCGVLPRRTCQPWPNIAFAPALAVSEGHRNGRGNAVDVFAKRAALLCPYGYIVQWANFIAGETRRQAKTGIFHNAALVDPFIANAAPSTSRSSGGFPPSWQNTHRQTPGYCWPCPPPAQRITHRDGHPPLGPTGTNRSPRANRR